MGFEWRLALVPVAKEAAAVMAMGNEKEDMSDEFVECRDIDEEDEEVEKERGFEEMEAPRECERACECCLLGSMVDGRPFPSLNDSN